MSKYGSDKIRQIKGKLNIQEFIEVKKLGKNCILELVNVAKTLDIITPKPRIEAFSDIIFGLALSIGAILLVSVPPTTNMEIFNDLFFFTFSFVILIIVWHRYTAIMTVLPVETMTTLILNIVLLFAVGIEPYLFNLTHTQVGELLNTVTSLYALDLGVLQVLLGFFTHELTVEERKLIPAHLILKYIRIRNFEFLNASIFFLSAFPIFGTIIIARISLRIYLWIIPVAIMVLGRVVVK